MAGPVASFPLLVPWSFVHRMQVGDRCDPLLQQVLPTIQENVWTAGFDSDPVGDCHARHSPGLLQKYHGRALLITAGACAVHCRYCFRRDYPYAEDPRRLDDWQPALQAISEDPTIREIILSGGDPLMLSDSRLHAMLQLLEQVPHLERIRIHTRLPVVLPARVTSSLLQMLERLRCQPIVVVHANHGNEVTGDCELALKRMVRSGIPVLNQTVLLRNINDTADALEGLCRRLINVGVMPYYLHQLDRVQGAAHFEVDAQAGLAIMAELARRLPGYAVPRYVREAPGAPGKSPIRASAAGQTTESEPAEHLER